MKISDIVKVNISNITSSEPNSEQMNSVAAVLFIHKLNGVDEVGVTDTEWIPFADLDPSNEGYIGDDVIGRIESTFRINGGISLVCKRIYLDAAVTENDALAEIIEAMNGGDTHTGLIASIKNVQLAWDSSYTPTVASIADGVYDADAPENTKLLFVTSNALPASLSAKYNVFYHYATGNPFINYYESAAAMAYLSKINYFTDTIRDYEYTEWLGGASSFNPVDNKPDETQGKVNIFTELAGRNVIVGGVLTNGVRLITYYFELILSDRITSVLTQLTLAKLNFDQSTYSRLYNAITIELDVFAENGLLDKEFVSTEEKFIFRDSIRYTLVDDEEILSSGYVVNVLPPTQQDLSDRNFTGIFIHFAISNQIRTIEVAGLALGGVS